MRRIILVMWIPLVLAAALPVGAEPPDDRELLARLEALERETEQIRAETAALRETPVRLPAIEQTQAIAAVSEPVVPPPPPPEQSPFSLKDLQAELKKRTWAKGDFTITPYGFITVSGIYESERTVTNDYVLYVPPPEREGEGAWQVDPKSTRLGLNMGLPEVGWFPGAKVGGRAELDFQGQYINANKGGVLFRQAYVDVKHEDYYLLAGQTWEILSSLYPGMLMYVPASGVGNMGYRRAMVRADRFLDFSDTFMLTLQGSLNSNIVTDFVGDPTIAGRPAGWPIVEVRTLATLGERTGPDALPILVAFSGHIGEQEFSFFHPPEVSPEETVARTWSANLEFSFPITKQFGMQAEFFHGANLGAFMGGALQGIDRITRNPIRSTGGWVDVYYHWTDRWHTHVGWCLDDPYNADLTSGRTYNQVVFGNVVYDLTKSIFLGLEVSDWKTNWVGFSQGDSLRMEFVAKYAF
jgi:hypothetical protein